MVGMAQWAVIIPADRWATERLFQHETLTVTGWSEAGPQPGDDALLVADEHGSHAVHAGDVVHVRVP